MPQISIFNLLARFNVLVWGVAKNKSLVKHFIQNWVLFKAFEVLIVVLRSVFELDCYIQLSVIVFEHESE